MLPLKESMFWLQLAVGLAIGPFLVWYYRTYLVRFLGFATRYLGLTALILVLYLMVYGLLGVGLGIPYLFWHDDFWPRAFSSMGATILLAVIGVMAYYLDPNPWATDRTNAEFLSADEQIKHRIVSWYSRLAPRLSPRAIALPPDRYRAVRASDYVAFVLNVIFDLVSITPIQSWLDPVRANALRLHRFLRAARGPFLLLLLAPAVLPEFFSNVPRSAPTGNIGFEWLGYPEPPTLDVTRSPIGYGLSVLAWLLGIQVGVLVIKVFIRCSTVLYGNPLSDRALRVLAGAERAYRRSRWRAAIARFLGRVVRVFGGPAPIVGDDGAEAPRAHWVEENAACPHAGDAGLCAGPGCPRGEAPRARQALPDCLARRQLRLSALVFAFLFGMNYAVLGLIRQVRAEDRVPQDLSPYVLRLLDLPPAFAICVMLAVLAMAYAVIAYLPRAWKVPVVILLVAWFGLANNDPFKNRFENMDYSPGKRIPLRSRVHHAYIEPITHPPAPGEHAGLVVDRDALEAWKRQAVAEGGPDVVEGRPKLVLVAVSGGATRSAYWTAIMLDQLERKLGRQFGQRIRIISGASGGMLGTACYVTYRREVACKGDHAWRKGALEPRGGRPAVPPDWIRETVPCNSMDPLARYIALSEIWKAACPGYTPEDRGIALERDWAAIRYPISDLACLEGLGKIPSLIFSPMIVEDGRRLLISNLDLLLDPNRDLSPMVLSQGRQVTYAPSPHADGTVEHPYSLSGLEYFRLFPEASNRGLFLSTAVRMSATFPFVSPAVNLPTDSPRRIVDAGYYDNYGIEVATSWIHRNRDWLARNTSGVLLIQIRDASSVRDRLDVHDDEPNTWQALTRGFQFFTSPIDGVSEGRYATASFRNDADVVGLDSSGWEFGPEKPRNPRSFFTTAIFENSAEVSLHEEGDFWEVLSRLDEGKPVPVDFSEVSLTWYLTRAEQEAIRRAVPGDPPSCSRWSDPGERARMLDKLKGQVFAMLPDDKYDRLTEGRKEGMRREGKLCYPPGPERDVRLKHLERLRNYERLRNLDEWWGRAGKP